MAFVPSWVDDANYCPSCGTRLPKADVVSKTVDQLEAAIAYAIGETKKIEV
jgi:valyl-tRNA synthetase